MHPKFGFGTSTADQPFRDWAGELWVDYDLSRSPVESFRNTCINAASLHTNKLNGKLCVLLSGGLDSEIALRSFILSNADVEAFTFDTGVNAYDLNHAKRICAELNIKHHIYSIDLLDYFKSKSFEITREFYQYNIFWVYLTFLGFEYIIDKLNMIPVAATGNPDFSFSQNQIYCYTDTSRGRTMGYYWAQENNVDKIVPAFHFDTNIIRSYVFNNEVERANTTYHHMRYEKSGWYWYEKHLKQNMYLLQWPELIPRFNIDGNEDIFRELANIFSKYPVTVNMKPASNQIMY